MTKFVGSRERAKQFRQMLKASFPGTKFSVRCDTGTAWNWITVRWEDGPSASEVRELIGCLHEELTIERKYSSETQEKAAQIFEAHFPELEIRNADGSINWHLNTFGRDYNIGPKLVLNQTMHAVIHTISEHYVLGGEKQFSNAAERAAKQAAFLAEKAAKEAPVNLDELDGDDQNAVEHKLGLDAPKGRLTAAHPLVLAMHPGEKPHLDVRTVSPFEAVLRAVPDPEPEPEVDLTPREITSLSPLGRPLTIYSVPALVLADSDGYQAGETVWVGETISTVLDLTERVLVSRGDGYPLSPLTTNFLMLL
jgi:hypothetical protein